MSEQEKAQFWTLFHRLWGKGQDSPSYDEEEWKQLDLMISEIIARLKK